VSFYSQRTLLRSQHRYPICSRPMLGTQNIHRHRVRPELRAAPILHDTVKMLEVDSGVRGVASSLPSPNVYDVIEWDHPATRGDGEHDGALLAPTATAPLEMCYADPVAQSRLTAVATCRAGHEWHRKVADGGHVNGPPPGESAL